MDLSYLVYFQMIFYVIIGIAVLMGLLRGMKKTLFTLITMVIFYVAFFLTVEPVSKMLWSMQMPWLASTLSTIDSSLAGFTSFESSLGTFLQLALGESFDAQNISQEMLALATGLGQFVLKIVYTIIYFTVILLIYKLICWILGLIIIRKREKGESKNPLFGALFGAVNGVVAIFVMLIVFGGIMNVAGSLVQLIPSDQDDDTSQVVFEHRQDVMRLSYSVIPLDEPSSDLDTAEMVEALSAMVDAFDNNPFVKLANMIQTTSLVNPDESVAFHINLFDRVLSFDYNESKVAIRYELVVLSDVIQVFISSEFATTNEITDITGDEIRMAFQGLGRSNLIIQILPLAIEVAMQMMEQELPISREALYSIDFQEELPKIGVIAGDLFDILNSSGVISGGDVQDIVVDGDFVRDVFTNMSESEIVILLVEGLLVPFLEDSESEIGRIIKIPAGLEWANELVAIGAVLGAVFDMDLTFADLTGDDPTILLQAAASIDVDLILASGLISSTLINILSGAAGIEGLDMLVIPDGVTWLDQDLNGELRNILLAVQVILEIASDLDFENITIQTLASLTNDQIDDLFSSYIIVATISSMITSMDFGDTPVVIPDDVFDSQGYIEIAEMKALAKAVSLIFADAEGEEFDMGKVLSLSEADVDILLGSDIISATIGKLVVDLDIEQLIMPSEVIQSINVDQLPLDIVNETELKALLLGLAVLELPDFASMAFDASVIDRFVDSEDDTLIDQIMLQTFLGSLIIHSSVSQIIFDFGSGAGAVLSIPSLDSDGEPLVDDSLSVDYLIKAEIQALFQAMLSIGISDFSSIDLQNTSLLISHMPTLVASAILHKTISDQVLSIAASMLQVPYVSADDEPIISVQAETTYISDTELIRFFERIQHLGFTAPEDFTEDFDLTLIQSEADQDYVLESAILHATISNKLLSFGDDVLVIPQKSADNDRDVRLNKGVAPNTTVYVDRSEIKALINVLTLLEITTMSEFSGSVDLAKFYPSLTPLSYEENQNSLLASASMHATISKQLMDLDDAILLVPSKTVLGAAVTVTVSGTMFVQDAEIKALFNAMDVLELGATIDSMTGSFNLAKLNSGQKQDTLLASALMHATVSDKIFGIDDTILIVPEKRQDNTTRVIILSTDSGSDHDFIAKAEIKAMIDSLLMMGYDDLDSFTVEFDLHQVFSDPDTIMASAAIQAMFSKRLLEDTGTSLVIPEQFFVSLETLRIPLADVTYIHYDELVRFIKALDALDIDNFAVFDFTPTVLFALDDFNVVFASEIIQATVSKTLLDSATTKAEDESPDVGDLIIPNYFR
ncbi:MAG: hypothetical protein WC351_04725, partial [Candidatus Izemoplasmatales bacterium]